MSITLYINEDSKQDFEVVLMKEFLKCYGYEFQIKPFHGSKILNRDLKRRLARAQNKLGLFARKAIPKVHSAFFPG